MVEEDIVDTTEPGVLKDLLDNLSLQNNPSSLLSLLSSVTAKQARILNFIFTSEMMTIESNIRGDGTNPIMDVYNAAWLMINLNMFFKPAYADKMNMYVQNNTAAALQGMKWAKTAPMEYKMQQQLAAIINENSMKYITKLGDDIKLQLTESLKQSVLKGETSGQAADKLTNILKDNGNRARTIVRTETMRASNSAAYAQALSQGSKYYVIDSRAEACIFCKKNYDGKVFPITDGSGMPPLHPNCACIPVFFETNSDAKTWSNKLSEDIARQVAALEKKGLTVKPDGTGAEVNKLKPDERLKN